MNKKLTQSLLLVLALILALSPTGFASANFIPVTGARTDTAAPASSSIAPLAPFAASVATSGNPDLAAGIFAKGLFAAPIVQQPSSAPGFVSTEPEKATQFSMAAQYGTTALLAHNYLLGQEFFGVRSGDVLSLVYGDGHVKNFKVTEVLQYQALSPNSPYSDFVDLGSPNGERLSVTNLFYRVYNQVGKLVLQTCIEANGEPSWGRLFIIAEPQGTINLTFHKPRTRMTADLVL